MALTSSSRSNSLKQPHNSKRTPCFSQLVELFESLATERKQETKKKILNHWFAKWRNDVGNDIFPLLRLLLPHIDKHRPALGLQEANISKLYIKLFGVKAQSDDATRLRNWTVPTDDNKIAGDFAALLHDFVKKRSSVTEGVLTIKEVNDLLDDLANAKGAEFIQLEIFKRIFHETTPREQKWIVRIILKHMSISVLETSVLEVFHPDAQAIYDVTSDLRYVAWRLYDPTFRATDTDKDLRIGWAFKPMLSTSFKTIEESVTRMTENDPVDKDLQFFIEEKIDGERMQIHVLNGQYLYYSRKRTSYTHLYGRDSQTGSLTPHLANAFKGDINSLILDGEMVAIDKETGQVLPFGTLKETNSSGKLMNQPCFKVFDMLFINGRSLLGEPLSKRKREMCMTLKEVPGRVEFVPEFRGRTVEDVRTRLAQVMADRGEGLVLKHSRSTYIPNGRNHDWIKVKPEYMDGMADTFDLLVVAGNYGRGKRGGQISTLLCAVKQDGSERYSSFVRVGTGLKFEEYERITKMPSWKPRGPNGLPDWLQTTKQNGKWSKDDDKWDMYLDPKDAFVLEVKATEVVPSDGHHFSLTLRFPRAVKIRDDRNKDDCWTAADVLRYSDSGKKKRKSEDQGPKVSKKQKTSKL